MAFQKACTTAMEVKRFFLANYWTVIVLSFVFPRRLPHAFCEAFLTLLFFFLGRALLIFPKVSAAVFFSFFLAEFCYFS